MTKRLVWGLQIAAAVSFLAGYILAVLAGLWWEDNEKIVAALVVMGLLVGIFNITGKEILAFLVAAVALIIIGTSGADNPFLPLNQLHGGMGTKIANITKMLAAFTAPAAIVPALRAGIALAKPGD